MADGKVVIDTALNNKGFTAGVKGLKGQLGGLNSALKGIGKTIAAVFGVRALITFGKEAIELGSNVAEVQNVVDVAFGDMAYKIENFSKTSIQNFGMSQLAAKKTASTYMAMARGMKMNEQAASDMAISLTGLSGDVASFFNISQELADTKLKSVFTGETETLKDLGVVMTQANLKAYALSQGITKDIDKMSQAEQVGLRYNFVVDQLALANGDFARTSDSWANQTRILSMQWQEFMSIIGQTLITVLTPLVKMLNVVVSGLIGVANTFNSVVSTLFGGANTQIQQTQASAAGVGEAIGGSVENQEDLTDETKKTAKEQKKLLAGFDELSVLSDTSGSGGGGGAGGMGISAIGGSAADDPDTSGADGIAAKFKEIADMIWEYYDTNLAGSVNDAISQISESAARLLLTFQGVWGDIAALGAPLKEWFNGSFTTYLQTMITTWGTIISGLLDSFNLVFSDIWNIVIAPTLEKWATDILPLLTNIATECLTTIGALFTEIKGLFDKLWSEGIAPALGLIQKIWSDMWDGIIAAWEKHGKPIFDGIRELIRNVAATLQNVWETIIKPVWDKLMEVVTELWDNHLKPLWDNVLDFIGSAAEGLLAWWNNVLLPLVNWFIDMFGPGIAGAFNSILQVAGDVIGGIADFISGIITTLKGLMTFLTGIFTGDWKKAWQGIVDIFQGIFDAVGGIVKGVINIVIDVINGMMSAVATGINTVIKALNKLSFTVPDWVPVLGGSTWGFNIPSVVPPQIPRLAAGAVIPPNREFMAVLGDQKHGANIEAPEGLIRKIVQEENGNAAIISELRQILAAIREGKVLMVGKDEIGRIVQEALTASSRMKGYEPLTVR